MIRLNKTGIVFDDTKAQGFEADPNGIWFHFEEGPSVYISNEMATMIGIASDHTVLSGDDANSVAPPEEMAQHRAKAANFSLSIEQSQNLDMVWISMRNYGLDEVFMLKAFALARKDQTIYDLVMRWKTHTNRYTIIANIRQAINL